MKCLFCFQVTVILVHHTQIWLANWSVKAEDKQLLLGIYRQLLQSASRRKLAVPPRPVATVPAKSERATGPARVK